MKALRAALDRPPAVPQIATVSPLAGLARRGLGPVDALAQSVAAVAPTAGVATMPALVASAAGPGTAAAVCLAAVLVVLISSVISQYAKRLAVAGSLYSYTAQTGRALPAFLTGAALLTGYAFIAMFALAGAGIYTVHLLNRLAPSILTPSWAMAVTITLIGVLCFGVLTCGIRVSARATLALECGSVLLVLILLVMVLLRFGGPSWPALDPSTATGGQIIVGSVIALMAFVGFESSTVLGAETTKPLKSIPRALLTTVLITGLLYLVATYAQLAGFEHLDLALSTSPEPLAVIADLDGSPGMLLALETAIALSFLACVLASATALARVMFTMGREGVLPAWLGATHPRFQTPHRAIQAGFPLIVVVPLVLLGGGMTAWDVMTTVITCAAAAFVAAYILVCASLPLFLQRIGEVTVAVVLPAVVTAMLLTATLVMFLVASAHGYRGIGVAIFLILGILACLWYLGVRHVHAGSVPRIGLYDEPTRQDVLHTTGER